MNNFNVLPAALHAADELSPIHPGETLLEDYLRPMDMSAYALAKAIRVPVTRIHEIIHERRGITADTALRLGRYFGTSSEYWMNLQASHDLQVARRDIGARVEAEVVPLAREAAK